MAIFFKERPITCHTLGVKTYTKFTRRKSLKRGAQRGSVVQLFLQDYQKELLVLIRNHLMSSNGQCIHIRQEWFWRFWVCFSGSVKWKVEKDYLNYLDRYNAYFSSFSSVAWIYQILVYILNIFYLFLTLAC